MTAVRSLPAHETCRHKAYRLTCNQYEAMLRESGGQCATCCRPSQDSQFGKLAIDHDARVGDWAVRGLICHACNIVLRVDRPEPDWARDYLDNPWYVRMLRELGLTPECPPEPDRQLNRVRDYEGRVWWPRDDGWDFGHKASRTYSWRELHRRFGPHNLTVIPPGEPGRAEEPARHEGVLAEVRVDNPQLAAIAIRHLMPTGMRQELARLLLEE